MLSHTAHVCVLEVPSKLMALVSDLAGKPYDYSNHNYEAKGAMGGKH